MSQSKTLNKPKSKQDGYKMSYHDAVALVINTAIMIRDEEDHPIIVKQATVQGQSGMLIFMPGYEWDNRKLRRVS